MRIPTLNRPTPGRRAFLALLLALAASLALLASGCSLIVGADTKVNSDGSGTMGVRISADKELQSALGQQGAGASIDGAFAAIEQQLGPGWKTTRGTDPDGTQWAVASHDFKDTAELQQLTSGSGSVASLFSGFSVKRVQHLFRIDTTFKGTMDSSRAASQPDLQGQLSQLPAAMLGSVVQVENRITLPGTVKSNNATEVRGNTLVWRESGAGGSIDMQAASVTYRWGVIGLFIGGGAVAVVAAVLLLVFLLVLPARRRAAPAAVGVATMGAQAYGSEETVPMARPVAPEDDAASLGSSPGNARGLGTAPLTEDERALPAAGTAQDERALGASIAAADDRALPPPAAETAGDETSTATDAEGDSPKE